MFGDSHVPFLDPACAEIVLETIKREKPDKVIHLGDFLDCHDISRFTKIEQVDLAYEFEEGRKFLAKLRKSCGDIPIALLEGNHEYRLTKYIASQAPELRGLRGLSVYDQLDLKDFGITYHQNRGNGMTKFGPVNLRHGVKVSQHSAYSAKNEFEKKVLESFVMGHTHRMGAYFNSINKAYWAIEAGCTCYIDDVEYAPQPINWQQGFVIIEISDNHATFVPIEIKKSQAIIRGESVVYTAPKGNR